MSVRVTHSADRSGPESQMEEDTLIPFLVVTDNDEYQKEYFGFRCACHGWAVRESAVITKKKPFSLTADTSELR